MLRKTHAGRWQARLKLGRDYVASRTFDTRREAEAWLVRERAALAGGIDPRSGRTSVKAAYAVWLVDRADTVAQKTLRSDRSVLKALPASVANLHVNRVTDREVQRCINEWSRRYAQTTVRRYRASLMAFFAWCVQDRVIGVNPVSRTKVPAQRTAPKEMMPLPLWELEQVRAEICEIDESLADIVWIAAWTGLRWSELREVRVGDFSSAPVPRLIIRRAHPEGADVKGTKSNRARHVPLVDSLLPIVDALTRGRRQSDLLLTTVDGGQLNAKPFRNATRWATTGRGRRLHDLRHTAACLWLERGVPVTTVQAWMGHADLATTQRYLHYLGTSADEYALGRLNSPG